ncbi:MULTISPECIES: copper resistance protein B [Thalassospira]|jgi:copper resistance protein B|uniref:Copper resistance protein CopB n=3 Tax=Thalassospira TaxID=168934 RepID=A0A367X9B0_9PROT|nr:MULTISPECIES: copper resistance protein B [Thalassospira]MAL73590.1 copper resistance protein B [Rhodospirillaceae bacterium]MBR9818887.1 copper resistance protein B [Rhodospirillales bacterium]OAZ12441.1 copper resistance protein CopB [Thalassospira profundimaris]AXO15454.1 copper resistance protein B [Thalassospira indica]KZB55937.1 copper resistance protein CopB [Thalassospira xiamenensis]|tara:strand:+ start:657 stop:1379 length:723 start_codon:yes stop_codon:yes gene_type:complete
MKTLTLAAIGGGVLATILSFSFTAKADNHIFYGIQMEQFEYRSGDEDENLFVWDGDAFVGTDELKLRWQGEGERDLKNDLYENFENRLVLQTPISDFFDAKAGIRLDTPSTTDRWYGTVGIMGLAPQWFEVDADLFVSETGDGSARLDVEYEGLLTNRLILTPSLELNAAFSEDREIEVGRGFSSAEIGLRLSYDLIDRAVAPYIGVAYERKLGKTADFAKDDGEDYEATYLVTGLRLLF